MVAALAPRGGQGLGGRPPVGCGCPEAQGRVRAARTGGAGVPVQQQGGREEEEEKEEEEESAQNFLLYLLPVQGEEPGCGGVRGGRGGRTR